MSGIPADPDRPSLVARAWELAEQGYGVRYIAEVIDRAPSTAAEYVKEGRAAAQWIEVLDRAEERARKALRLELYAEWLMEERRTVGGLAKDYVPILLQVERERAKLTGSDAPTRVAVSDDRTPRTVDPDTVAAVRSATRAAESEVRALRAGEEPPQ